MLDQLEPMDDADALECRTLIEEHVERTGSPVGRRVLDDFDALRERFVMVFPADYKRVLGELAAQEAAASNGHAAHADALESETVDVVGVPDMRLGEGE
jgi:glutamate synthase (NADPH/NADH) large chain/glutamate synthase (ferredoxin)